MDTTAAGDVFNGALVVYLAQGKSLYEATTFACKLFIAIFYCLTASASLIQVHLVLAQLVFSRTGHKFLVCKFFCICEVVGYCCRGNRLPKWFNYFTYSRDDLLSQLICKDFI